MPTAPTITVARPTTVTRLRTITSRFTTDGPTTPGLRPLITAGAITTIPGTAITTIYYQPYPAYPSASPWLTDYILSENLRAAYEASLAGKATPLRAPFNQSEDLTASLWSSDFLIAGNLDAAYGVALYMSAAGKGNAAASQAELSREV